MPPVTDTEWAAGISRERRSEALLVLAEVAALAGYVLLHRDPATRPGYQWVVLAGLAVVLLWLQGVNLSGPVGLPGGAERYRVRYAVRAHVDPGPGLQDEADTYAERRATTWHLWLLPFWSVQLVHGRWHEPAMAVPASVLLVGGVAGMVVWYRRSAAASRRWLDDPPGRAPRPRFTPPPDQRPWTLTARQGSLLVVLVVTTVGVLGGAAQLFG